MWHPRRTDFVFDSSEKLKITFGLHDTTFLEISPMTFGWALTSSQGLDSMSYGFDFSTSAITQIGTMTTRFAILPMIFGWSLTQDMTLTLWHIKMVMTFGALSLPMLKI